MSNHLAIAKKLRILALERFVHHLDHPGLPTLEMTDELLADAEQFARNHENFFHNQMWGHQAIIRHHYKLGDGALPIVITHGPWCHNGTWRVEFMVKFPILVYSYHHAFVYAEGRSQLGFPETKLILHTIPYELVSIARRQNSLAATVNARHGCVFFPTHSTHRFRRLGIKHTSEDLTRYSRLRDRFGRLNLCLFYLDYQLLKQDGLLDEYTAPFDTVFCCGARYEPAFLCFLEAILSSHEAVYTDEWSSIALYASISKNRILIKKYTNFQYQVEQLEAAKWHSIALQVNSYFSRASQVPEDLPDDSLLEINRPDVVRSFVSGVEDKKTVGDFLEQSRDKEIFLKNPSAVFPQDIVDIDKYFLSR